MNKMFFFCWFLLWTTVLYANPLDPGDEADIREKLKTGLLTRAKDQSGITKVHQEDLPSLHFESIDIPFINLPKKEVWKKGPQTVEMLLDFSSKTNPQQCIFVKKDGKYIGFMTSVKSSYLDQKIGGEIQKIYDTYGKADVIWAYYNAGNLGKWLTFSVKSVGQENLTLVDTSGNSPQGYYYKLLPLKQVIERGLDMD